MKYIIVEDKTIVHLGPMFWNARRIQSELDDLEVAYVVPQTEQGYVQFSATPLVEIFPIVSSTQPDFDPTFEHLSGPWYTYANNEATETWGKDTKDLAFVRAYLKDLTASVRYDKEVGGAKATIQGQTVTVDTSRDGRNIFVQSYMLLADTDTIKWKFPEGWLLLTKADLGACVMAGVTAVQTAFLEEHDQGVAIDAATDTASLQAIYLVLNPPAPNLMKLGR